MVIEIRIYRRHDADLMMLKTYGINIPKMIRQVLDNYVAGKRVKYSLPGSHVCDIDKTSMVRCRVNIDNPAVVALLKNIKHGYRNQFCKMLIRDSLETETLGVYLADKDAIKFEGERIKKAPESIQQIGEPGGNRTFEQLKEDYLEHSGSNKQKTQNSQKPASAASAATSATHPAAPQTKQAAQQSVTEAIASKQQPVSNPANIPVNKDPGLNTATPHADRFDDDELPFPVNDSESTAPVNNSSAGAYGSYSETSSGYESDDPSDEMDDGYDEDNPFGFFGEPSQEEKDKMKKEKQSKMLDMFNQMLSGE